MEIEINDCDFRTKNESLSSVPVLNKKLSYDEFFTKYMYANVPCVITNVTENWEASCKWLTEDKTPDLSYLKSKYGSCNVTIYHCNEKYFNSQKTSSCKFAKFLEEWNSETSQQKYLKDWHLKNSYKNDNFYQVPIYFASDWLNEYLTEKNDDDYRFVYMGPSGTWTPFHVDVFNSFSWSANVCGRKKWILLPPGQENVLRDSLKNLPYDVSAVADKVRHFQVTQNPGEAVFVPSGWYHQVWNLEDTISINHNWVNGCNILKMWLAIEENLASVKREIEDCEDMDGFIEHCQVVLEASFGTDFYKFYDFLKFITLRRLEQVNNQDRKLLFHGHVLGLNHAKFDLEAAKSVLEKFTQHSDVLELFQSNALNPEKLLEQL